MEFLRKHIEIRRFALKARDYTSNRKGQ